MLYSIKYLTMAPIKEERDGIMCDRRKGICSVCGRMTRYIDIDFETHICSDKCRNKLHTWYLNWVLDK